MVTLLGEWDCKKTAGANKVALFLNMSDKTDYGGKSF